MRLLSGPSRQTPLQGAQLQRGEEEGKNSLACSAGDAVTYDGRLHEVTCPLPWCIYSQGTIRSSLILSRRVYHRSFSAAITKGDATTADGAAGDAGITRPEVDQDLDHTESLRGGHPRQRLRWHSRLDVRRVPRQGRGIGRFVLGVVEMGVKRRIRANNVILRVWSTTRGDNLVCQSPL